MEDHSTDGPLVGPSTNRNKDILVLKSVSKTYRGAVDIAAVDGVSLNLEEGEFLSIIGPSGCGKSTLFNLIGGLVGAYEGEILIDQQPVHGIHPDIGMVFQEESTFPWRTTLQNVAFGLEAAGVPRKEREELAGYYLRLVGLEGFENAYPAELSGGMRQRTALARTLAIKPKILLLDEPFGALDEQTRLLLGDQLLRIWEELQQTILLVTHSITEAVQLSTRVAAMSFRPGRIKRVFDIDLPRPRSSEVLVSDAFGRLVGAVWGELQEEASRGMLQVEETLRFRGSQARPRTE